MNRLEIIKTGNSIDVVTNLYTSIFGYKKVSYNSTDLHFIGLLEDESGIMVEMEVNGGHKREFTLTFDQAYAGTEHMIVDTVDGVAPSSNQDLFNKLTGLR